MINTTQMRELIQKTLLEVGDKFANNDAVQLVLETGLVESHFKYLKQLGNGPAKSFWQVEPATAVDNLVHFLKHRKTVMAKCAEASLLDLAHWQTNSESLWADILEKNIAAGIIHCRIKYWRVPKRMPNTLEGRARYWKQYYNSQQVAGTEEKYVDTVKEYLK